MIVIVITIMQIWYQCVFFFLIFRKKKKNKRSERTRRGAQRTKWLRKQKQPEKIHTNNSKKKKRPFSAARTTAVSTHKNARSKAASTGKAGLSIHASSCCNAGVILRKTQSNNYTRLPIWWCGKWASNGLAIISLFLTFLFNTPLWKLHKSHL